MRRLIIGFSRAKSIFKIGSIAIQKADCRNYSHCYIRYTCDSTKVELIAQASHGFVNMVSKDIFLEQNIIVKEYAVDCTEEQYLTLLIFVHNNLGKPYSKLQLILIAIKKLVHIEVNYHDQGASYICSEFVTKVCSFTNVPTPLDLDYVDPSDLDKILQDANIGVL